MKPDVDGPTPVTVHESDLLHRAREARRHAYAPYSGFRVGAAVLSASGQVHTGANVENAAYPLGGCAEQTAIRTMVAGGDHGPILAVAVVGDGEDPCTPCGGCRQVIFEHGPRARVLASGDGGRPLRTTIDELLPYAFGPHRLGTGVRDAL